MRQLIDKKKYLILYFLFFVALSTTTNKNLYKDEKLFQIENINISGIPLENIDGIHDGLYASIEKNIFFLKKEKIKKSISKFNIIEKYTVKKIYPGELNIDIEPTKIIAKISNKENIFVGANGKLISNHDFKKKLPFVFGQFDSNKFLDLKIQLERSEFNFENFDSLFYYPSGRWDVLTTENVLIKLPSKKLYESLNLAKKILNNSDFKKNKFIDLRIENQMIVK